MDIDASPQRFWEANDRLFVNRNIFNECSAEIQELLDLPTLLDGLKRKFEWVPATEVASLSNLLDLAEEKDADCGCFKVYMCIWESEVSDGDALGIIKECAMRMNPPPPWNDPRREPTSLDADDVDVDRHHPGVQEPTQGLPELQEIFSGLAVSPKEEGIHSTSGTADQTSKHTDGLVPGNLKGEGATGEAAPNFPVQNTDESDNAEAVMGKTTVPRHSEGVLAVVPLKMLEDIRATQMQDRERGNERMNVIEKEQERMKQALEERITLLENQLQEKQKKLDEALKEKEATENLLLEKQKELDEALKEKDEELQKKNAAIDKLNDEMTNLRKDLHQANCEKKKLEEEVTECHTSNTTLLKALRKSQLEAEKFEEKWKRAVEPRGAHHSRIARPKPVHEEEQTDCVENTPRSSLKFGQLLGSGGFGTVCEGWWRFRGDSYHVAIKELKDVNNDTRAKLKQYLLEGEGTLMFKMDHKNVVRFYCVCTEENELRLFSEFAPEGSLLSHLKQNKEKLGARTILTFILQIAEGMAYLEEKRMVHGVLAARNVLLFSDSLIKITDFGLARLIEAGKGLCEAVTEEGETQCTARGGVFPVCCMAPESLQKTTYTHKSDVWSYGVTVWEVLTFGAQPYEEKQPKEILPFLESGSRLVQPVTCSPDLYSILMECWSLHPDARPSFAQVVKRLSVKLQDPPSFIFTMVDGVLSNYDDLPSNCSSPHNYSYMYLGHEHVCTKVKEPHDRPDHPGPDAQPRGGHTSAGLSPTSDSETPPDAN